MRTSGPFLPSGRSAGSTCHSEPAGGRRRADPHQPGREVGGDGRRLLLGHPVGRLGDEDDVDVGDVVQLAPPHLPIAMTARRVRSASGAHLGAGDRQGRLERGLRRGRPARRPSSGRVTVGSGDGQVEGRDAEQLLAVGRAQHVGRGRRPGPAWSTAVDQAAHPLVDGERRSALGRPHVQCSGWAHEVVAERRRAAEHREQPLACGPRCAAGPRSPVPRSAGLARDGLHEPDQRRAARRRGRAPRRAPRPARRPRCGRGCGSRPARAGSSSRRLARAGSANPSRAMATGIDPGPRELTG